MCITTNVNLFAKSATKYIVMRNAISESTNPLSVKNIGIRDRNIKSATLANDNPNAMLIYTTSFRRCKFNDFTIFDLENKKSLRKYLGFLILENNIM